MYCIKCGAEFPEDANFCHACGSRAFRSIEVGTSPTRSLDEPALKHRDLSDNPNVENKNHRQCPACRKSVPSDTTTCRCGYSFQTEPRFSFSKILSKCHELTSLTFQSQEQAQKAIQEAAVVSYVVAALSAIAFLYFFLGESMIFYDGALIATGYSGIGFWLHRTSSRIAATVLLVIAMMSVGTTAWNWFGAGEGGGNIVLAIIVVIVVLRGAVAAYKLPVLDQPRLRRSAD